MSFNVGDLIVGNRYNTYGVTTRGTEWVVYQVHDKKHILVGPKNQEMVAYCLMHGKDKTAANFNATGKKGLYDVESKKFDLVQTGWADANQSNKFYKFVLKRK